MGRSHEIAGAKGGRTTFERLGREHFRKLGRRGIRGLADRYFQGSVADAMAWLRSRAGEHRIARGVDEKLERQLAEGADVACEELPVLCEPDNDPSFWRDMVEASRREREAAIPF